MPARSSAPARSRTTVSYPPGFTAIGDRKSTRLNSSHLVISYAVFCLKKKKIDAVDDFVWPRPQPLDQFHPPGFERLRQQRVLGVAPRRHRWLAPFLPAAFRPAGPDAH